MTEVRFNVETHRAITACTCGRTVSLPAYGISRFDCPCGNIWRCDDVGLAMYVPKDRLKSQRGLQDGSGQSPN